MLLTKFKDHRFVVGFFCSRVEVKGIHILILFNLILYVSSTIFQLNRDGSSCVEPVLT